MKVAFDARAWSRPPHSYRRVLSLLVEAAATAGWDVELWCDEAFQPEYARFEPRARRGAGAWRASQADVLWSPSLNAMAARQPTVLTIHDVNPLLPDGRAWWVRWWRTRGFHRKTRRALRRAWRMVTDSEDARLRAAAVFPRLASRFSVIPLYVDPNIRRPDTAERDRRLHSLGLDEGYVLFLASLRRHKNWDGLVRAYGRLPADLRHRHPLVLAGPIKRHRQRIEKLCERAGVRGNVRLTGAVAEEDLSALYAGAALFVFPSFLEGFGLPPLEAMSCGVPVVSSDRTSLPEVLGDAPVYVNPGDTDSIAQAMAAVLTDTPLRERLVAAGLRRAGAFGPGRTAEAMRRLLADLGRP